MPSQTQTFKLSYTVDSELIWSTEEYLVNYLTDIPLRGLGGEKISDAAIEAKIRIATSQWEGYLSIRIAKQRAIEQQDFEREHFENWGNIHANLLVTEVNVLQGKLNFARQITYPKGWISLKRQIEKSRNIHIVPG